MHPSPTLVDSPDFSLKHRVILPTVKSDGKTPCVVLLHGIGSDENDLLELGSRFGPEFLVISARAPIEVASGAYAWFKVRFTPNGPIFDVDEALTSLGLISNFIKEIRGRYGIGKTVVAGFSQGGIMSACLALTEPESVTGFAMLSGRIPSEIGPKVAPKERLSKLKAFVSHGIYDERLPIGYARAAKTLLEGKGVELAYGEYGATHQITGEMESDFGNWIRETLYA